MERAVTLLMVLGLVPLTVLGMCPVPPSWGLERPARALEVSPPAMMTPDVRGVQPGPSALASQSPSAVGVSATWSNQTRADDTPGPREWAGMVYDGADGYTVLFGGYTSGNEATQKFTCSNSTWVYEGGEWTNLSILGPPANCAPIMTYDAADGYVLETGGVCWSAGCAPGSAINQTWEFSRGQWHNSTGANPSVDYGSMAFDPAIGAVVLCGLHELSNGSFVGEEWNFHGGSWTEVTTPAGTTNCGGFVDLTYDTAADGILAFDSSANGVETWLLRGGTWTQESAFPFADYGTGQLAFDPKDDYTVFFGGVLPFGEPNNHWVNVTYVFFNDQWINASTPGPPALGAEALTFDYRDGYVLLYGGAGLFPTNEPNNLTAHLRDDTWVFSPPPYELQIRLTALPIRICSLESLDCGLGTTLTRLTLSVNASIWSASDQRGVDTGQGVVDWGPFYWTSNATLEFVGWHNLVPAATLDPSAYCTGTGFVSPGCSSTPSMTGLPANNSLLKWTWGRPGPTDTLSVGDYWSVSFNEIALGPPFTSNPVDACSTSLCNLTEVQTRGGAETAVQFNPYGNDSQSEQSAPLCNVTVLAAPVTSNPPPSGAPTPPAPPVGAPLPGGLPVAPSPASPPVASPVVTALGSVTATVSVTAAAGGLLSAAAARYLTQRRTVRVAQPIRATASRRRLPPPPSRGVD